MLPIKKNATNYFFGFRPFLVVFNQKTAKIDKNEENWQNPNRSMKFSEILYVDASQQQKMLQIFFFGFWPFLAVFQPKNSQN